MSNNAADVGTRLSAIAIAQDGSKLKAVELSKQGRTFEVLWTKSSEAGDLDWKAFELECGLAAEPTGQAEANADKIVVVGFDSAGVVFYCIDVPSVKEEEIAAMVRLQAEARLPLPAEHMELAWRANQGRDGKTSVTIVAAKREQLQKSVKNVRGFEPEKILLDCEGIVKAWRTFFSGDERDAVVVSIAARNTQVCLAQNGRLSNAVVLDMGTEDFAQTNQHLSAFAAGGFVDQTETTERFTQDIKSVLELFGCAEPAELPVFVLSDGSAVYERIVSSLGSAGLNVRAACPQIQKLNAETRLGAEGIYEYHVPIGLALMALDGDTDGLNIFERLYSPPSEAKRRHWLYSPKAAFAVAAVMLILMVIISYAVDVVSPGAIEKRLRGMDTGANIDLLIQRQTLIKSVAPQRPNLLELLNQINTGDSKGIMLDKLEFKKGRPVSISGQTQKAEQMYDFQKNLLTKKGITDVKIQSATPDSKTKKLKFTMTFHYKNFTKKRTSR